MRRTLRKRNRGQTALEYALVIGVIAVGVIMTAKLVFMGDESPAKALMNQAVESASGTMGCTGDDC